MTNSRTFFATIGLAVLSAVIPANAQTITSRVTVPYQFLVGNTELPGGTYLVGFNTQSRRIELFSRNGRAELQALPNALRRTEAGKSKGWLVFSNYGGKYALRKVWNPGQTRGYQLPSSSRERELAARYPSVEVTAVTGSN